MFAALYGELAPHPWRNRDTAQNAFFLFYDRSLAMGWLDDAATDMKLGGAGLWGMNDAGQDHPLAPNDAAMIAWFHVGVEPVPEERPLPVQPFLRCAGDAAARVGIPRLQAVQVLLPVQVLHPSSRPESSLFPSLRTVDWFRDCDPQSRTPVRVTLDSGQASSIRSAVPRIREWISRLDQDVFRCDSYSLTDHDPLTTQPPFDDYFWNGPSLHRATFNGTIAEWSLDALGWLGALIADLSARHGVTTPLLLTARSTA